MAVGIVTKAELSRILGVSRARVTQYAHMGMPMLSDGKLDLAACLEGLSQNVFCGTTGGSTGVFSGSSKAGEFPGAGRG